MKGRTELLWVERKKCEYKDEKYWIEVTVGSAILAFWTEKLSLSDFSALGFLPTTNWTILVVRMEIMKICVAT